MRPRWFSFAFHPQRYRTAIDSKELRQSVLTHSAYLEIPLKFLHDAYPSTTHHLCKLVDSKVTVWFDVPKVNTGDARMSDYEERELDREEASERDLNDLEAREQWA